MGSLTKDKVLATVNRYVEGLVAGDDAIVTSGVSTWVARADASEASVAM